VVAKAKQLADSGYRVFVIGFGSTMPPYLLNTLHWMAYYGGTDDPNVANSGSTSAYNITSGCDPTTSPVTNPAACCNTITNATACFPSGVTSCATDGAAVAAACYDNDHPYPGTGISTSSFRASASDPGYLTLSGYAFIAADADALTLALRTAINIIREATYSFSQASVQAQRTQDENYLFEGSFQPVSGDPFWLGHLRKFSINADGTVATTAAWDAGTLLQARAASTRNIKTYKAGSLIDFNTTNITAADLGVADTAHRDAVVGYIRGEAAYNPDNWKLGDVFRSNPMTIGMPSLTYDDFRDAQPSAFAAFRTNHVRASSKGNRLIVAGANDGQMHAFSTFDGSEVWSFIPPNLLSKLKTIAHATEPTTLAHMYFVDGPVTVANVWLGASTNDTSKAEADWRTLMIFGEGRGAGPTYLWSSSQYCDSGFSTSGSYSAAYPYYCGYYALDVTGTSCTAADGSCTAPPPVFRWRMGGSAASMATYGPYLSEPWSKVMVGKILIDGHEKWAGFVGGGGGVDGSRGNGFFIVDLNDGSILRGFTPADDINMVYGMLAGPSTVDSDRDGFVDTVYLGDRGGNMWRFKLCRMSDGSGCNATNWEATRLFNAAGSGRPIFAGAAAARDTSENLWVYWGTGDKLNETSTTSQDAFFALKDNDRTTTYTSASLQNVSSTTYTDASKSGWYINLSLGEKILATPTVFGSVVYFTTYTPPAGTDPCAQGGVAKIYALSYMTGEGAIPTTGARSITLAGTGIPSAPIISLRPDTSVPDIYATTSGAGVDAASTAKVPIDLAKPGSSMIYWRDMRVQ
jgi:type IV pilus assembly protein PilY1